MKILFITSNRVGDAVLSTGVLGWLVDHYPDAEFTIACGPYAAGLFRAVPRLERLIVLEKKSWNRHWLELWRICAGTRWHLIVDLRNSIVSRLLRTDKRISASGSTGQHKVVENAGVLNLNPPPAPRLWLDEKAEREAAKILPTTRPLLALAPGANWPCKQWPIERFAELARMLMAYPPLLSAEALAKADGAGRNSFADQSRQMNFGEGSEAPLAGAHVIVIADTHEREQVAPLLQSLPADKRVEIIGRDLLTVAAVIKQCALFVGNDSGLMHVAAAVGTPTLGLFGPGFEEIYGPWGPHCAFVRTIESREELLSRIPDVSARGPNLMGGLSGEKVYGAALKLLK